MIFVIPSYDRPHILKQRTLSYLERCGVDDESIHIFIVDDPRQKDIYGRVLGDRKYHIHDGGPLGLHMMRNYITKTFLEGTHILSMDDDIRHLVYKTDTDALAKLEGPEFLSWAEGAFSALELSDTKLFGVYPIRNAYFMKDLPYVTTNLRFCVGACWGCINDHRVIVSIEEKEDYERTMICYKLFNSVLRYNHVAPVTSYYTTPGGMQSRLKDRIEESQRSCAYLVATFPGLCKLGRVKKTTGIHEIVLTRQLS